MNAFFLALPAPPLPPVITCYNNKRGILRPAFFCGILLPSPTFPPHTHTPFQQQPNKIKKEKLRPGLIPVQPRTYAINN